MAPQVLSEAAEYSGPRVGHTGWRWDTVGWLELGHSGSRVRGWLTQIMMNAPACEACALTRTLAGFRYCSKVLSKDVLKVSRLCILATMMTKECQAEELEENTSRIHNTAK